MGGFGHAQFFEPIRYRFRVVTILPPAGVPGDVYVLNTGGTYSLYVWNNVTNTWVGIIIDNYVAGPTGPDFDTDITGPASFTDFRILQLWTQVIHSAYFTHAFGLNGELLISTAGAAGANTNVIFSGVASRKGLWPDAAGLIDISFTFDTCNISNPGALHQTDLLCVVSSNETAGSAIGIGVEADAVFQHANYFPVNWNSLTANAAPGAFGTASGDMAANLVSATIRFQFRTLLSGGTFLYLLDHPNATYVHNGLPAVALGGALTGTGAIGNAWLAHGSGLKVSLGIVNTIRMPGAGQNARLTNFTLNAGRLVG